LKEAFMAVSKHIARRCREENTNLIHIGGITLSILE
jgi:hypothetical protein